MSSILETVNNKREETISKHFDAALEDLQTQIQATPLQTKFYVYAGCVSGDITKEIANRFVKGNVKATANSSGLITSSWYLTIDIELPESLAPAVEVYTMNEAEKAVVEASQ